MDGQKTAQELANEALGAIGDDALAKTGGDLWRARQPLLTEPNQPQPEAEPAAESTSVTATETAEAGSKPTSEPELKLVLGKWKSEEEALRGYHEAVHMGNTAKAERDALASQLSDIQRATAPTDKPELDPFEELESFGMPREVTERAVRKLTQQAVQEMFAPTFSRIQADQAIVEKYPEYKTRFDDLAQFMETNPDVKDSVIKAEAAGQFDLAREYAWLRFVNSNVQKIETDIKAAGETRQAEIKRDRKDAAILASPSTTARTKSAETGLSNEEFQRLKDLAKAGHPAPLWRETIGRTLPKDFDSLLGG